MQIKDRINEFIRSRGLSIKEFEEKIGKSNGSWKNAKTISEDVLICFLEAFPEINLEWPLRGQGEMLVSGKLSSSDVDEKLLGLCKLLIENYQQRDQVMSELVSIVKGKL